MSGQNARLRFLRLIEEKYGEWGWYRFERAFPPTWFIDEDPSTTAKSILDELEADGLFDIGKANPHPKYRLTDKGLQLLQESAVALTTG